MREAAKNYLDLWFVVAWLSGIACQQLLPQPVAVEPCLLMASLLCLGIWWLWPRSSALVVVLALLLTSLLGLLRAGWTAENVVESRLDSSLNRARCIIQGQVASIDSQTESITRFLLSVEQAQCLDRGQQSSQPNIDKVRLAWYRPDQAVALGERWSMQVVLKRPHGMANPGLFDYSLWLAQRGVGATGYVASGQKPHKLAEPAGPAGFVSVDLLRGYLAARLTEVLAGHPQTAVIRALALGDRSGLDPQTREQMQLSGTSHLLAVSGLHIGLIGSFVWALFSYCWRLYPRGMLWVPAPIAGAPAGWLAAGAYALLSGFALPAQRSLIMFSVAVLAVILRREVFSRRSFLLAMVLVTLWQPLALLQPGFWLSFGALAVIAWALVGRPPASGWLHYGFAVVRVQTVIWIGLLPLGLYFFQSYSVVSLPANLVAIPVITLLVLPLALLGTLLMVVNELAGGAVLLLAAQLSDLLWSYLQWLVDLGESAKPGLFPRLRVDSLLQALVTALGALWLAAPRGVPARGLGLLCLLPLVIHTDGEGRAGHVGEFDLVVHDVGQGLALTITTANHVLVYDVGARFSERFDVGRDIVAQSLLRRGRSHIDRLVISHADNDHAGGLSGLLEQLSVGQIITGTPEQLQQVVVSGCSEQDWEWDGVAFHLFNVVNSSGGSDNDRSCLLRVGGAQGVLVPGDISGSAERQLLAERYRGGDGQQLSATVLLVPHHGSRFSSTPGWLDAIDPQIAVVSSGYANRFNHPHVDVVTRYRQRSIRFLDTADVGAVTIHFNDQGVIDWWSARGAKPRYWH